MTGEAGNTRAVPAAIDTAAEASHSAGLAGLAGARVLVTRGGAAGERDVAEVRRRCGRPLLAPLTVIAPPVDSDPLHAAAAAWNRGEYDWMLITSANAADAFAAARSHAPQSSEHSSPRTSRIAAVGPVTADALRAHGLDPDLVPPADYSAVGLATALLDLPLDASLRFLLPVSELADRTLEAALQRAGHRVDRVAAYRTLPAPRDVAIESRVSAGEVDVILVLSGSGAQEIARRFAPLPEGVRLAAIGLPSARALAEHGLDADVVAEPHTVSNLLDRVALTSAPRTSGGSPA